jgi:aminomethyltransferase
MSLDSSLFRTALYPNHIAANGRMVPFAGWEMPVQYEGVLAEVKAVRGNVGIFDVSHMGRLYIEGDGSGDFLERVLTFYVKSLKPGRARYGFILTEDGGVIDDTVVYQQSAGDGSNERYLLICNASNRDTVTSWFNQHMKAFPGVSMTDFTTESIMMAVQGPVAVALVDGLCAGEERPSSLRSFGSMTQPMKLDGETVLVEVFIGRTGYTGEDGFELIADAKDGPALWAAVVEAGATPCGLGSRDVLRLEAGLRLHGSDMDTATSPLEAGLDRFVNMEKGSFIGKKALTEQSTQGLSRKLVGFRMLEAGIPRHECLLHKDAIQIGVVTSGTYSASLDTGIGMGYVSLEHSALGYHVQVDLRGRAVEAEIVELPFYHRAK